jgi:thioesterase domain-containing protein/acyl carrier protein
VVPSALVAMREWPLTANGKIDRRRLPAPDGRDLVLAAPKARRTTTVAEAQLRARVAEIFAEILRANEVDSSTSFFDAGGDSLSAVLLVDRLQREFGVTVAVADFLKDPTPTAVALSLLAGGATASIEPVVPIMPTDAAATLHCFPGVGGLAAFTYLPLAGKLRDTCRCLGYQLPGAADGEEPSYSLARAARLRTPLVIERSAGRPIHLIGFSFGGILALEVAAQLEDAGHDVAGVTLLDSAPIRNRDRASRLGRALLKSLGLSRASRKNRKIEELAGVRTVRGADLGAVERRLRRVMDCAGLSLAWHRIRNVRCPIDVVLSNGVDVSAEDVTDSAACERWKRYSSAEVRVVRTAATHNGLVRNEGVAIVAGIVRRQIDAAAAARPA